MSKHLPALRIGQHSLTYPIIQGAMGVKVSGANLAGAVANAGGMGVISSLGLGLKSPEFLDKNMKFQLATQMMLAQEVEKARAISPNGVIGVNVLVPMRGYLCLARTAAEAGADAIIVGAGLPLLLPEILRDYPHVVLIPIVSSMTAVTTLCEAWKTHYNVFPSAFIVENPKGVGGHYTPVASDYSLEGLMGEIRGYLLQTFNTSIPLIATGGVWDSNDLDRMIALGADGVQIGTRFITTEECDADIRYKEFHLQANHNDIVSLPSPVGKPTRVLQNTFSQKVINEPDTIDKRCVANCLESCLCRDQKETYCLIQALEKASSGDLENGVFFSSGNVKPVNKIVPVAELMAELVRSN